MTAGIQQCRCTTQGAMTTWQNLQLVCITSQEEEWFLLLLWLENLKQFSCVEMERWNHGSTSISSHVVCTSQVWIALTYPTNVSLYIPTMFWFAGQQKLEAASTWQGCSLVQFLFTNFTLNSFEWVTNMSFLKYKYLPCLPVSKQEKLRTLSQQSE